MLDLNQETSLAQFTQGEITWDVLLLVPFDFSLHERGLSGGKNCKIQMTQQSLLLFSFSRIGKKKRMENLIEIFSVQLKLE